MRATQFEFERRFWIICATYAIASSLSYFDHVDAIAALRHLLAPSLALDRAHSLLFARLVISAGAFLVFVAAALRTWAAAYLRTEVVHDTAQHAEALVADGPFRHLRNPLYLGSVLMAAGLGLLFSRSGWLFLVAANWVFVYRLIFREENALRESQGDSFRAYCRAVPRFWPALVPRVPSGNHAPQWGQAFAGESFVWLFGVAELSLAVTLNAKIALTLIALGFAVHFFAKTLLQKKTRT